MARRPAYAQGASEVVKALCKGLCCKVTFHELKRNATEVADHKERFAGCLAVCLKCGKTGRLRWTTTTGGTRKLRDSRRQSGTATTKIQGQLGRPLVSGGPTMQFCESHFSHPDPATVAWKNSALLMTYVVLPFSVRL